MFPVNYENKACSKKWVKKMKLLIIRARLRYLYCHLLLQWRNRRITCASWNKIKIKCSIKKPACRKYNNIKKCAGIGLNTQYMTNSTLVSPVKMEYGWNFSISGLKLMMKSGLGKIFLKFLYALTMLSLLCTEFWSKVQIQ